MARWTRAVALHVTVQREDREYLHTIRKELKHRTLSQTVRHIINVVRTQEVITKLRRNN